MSWINHDIHECREGLHAQGASITMASHLQEHHGVSNHWQLDCLFKNLFRLTTTQTSKLCISGPMWGESTGHYWSFVMGIHWWPVDSHHKGPVTQKTLLCHDIIIIVMPSNICWYTSISNPKLQWFIQHVQTSSAFMTPRNLVITAYWMVRWNSTQFQEIFYSLLTRIHALTFTTCNSLARRDGEVILQVCF